MYLSQIYTHPIKSTHPISLGSSYLFETGVAYDRHWMVVDQQNTMVTSRKHPKLLHVITRIEGRNLVVELPCRSFLLPLSPMPQKEQIVNHWDEDTFRAWTQNSALDQELSEYLGIPCQVVYSASLASSNGDEIVATFADAQPLLLTTTSSLDALNERLDDPITMQRFRSNLVVSNLIPDIEDDWHRIRIGGCELKVVYPCERCVLTTIDPVTLLRHPRQEPLRTLGQYRRLEGAGVGFGINLTVSIGGVISINDTVEILS